MTSIWVMHPGRGWKMLVSKCLLNSTKDPFGFSELGKKNQPLLSWVVATEIFLEFSPRTFGKFFIQFDLQHIFTMGGGGSNPPTRFAPTHFSEPKTHGKPWPILALPPWVATRHFMNGYEAHEAAEKVTKKAVFLGVFFW